MLNKPILFLLILVFPISLIAGKNSEGLIPDYKIVKNERDPSLNSKEAIFVFTFKNIPVSSSIKASCNSKEKDIITDSEGKYTFKTIPGKYKFQLFYNNEFFEVYVDTIKIDPGYKIEIDINFQSSLYPVIMDKPVIYCYPQEKMNIHIDLNLKGNMLFTYPIYNNGWDFIAEPNGTIHSNGKQFKYLFWEGETQINYNTTHWNQGAIVTKENLFSFLETSLDQMGMNTNEQQDFITYWYPLMQKNEKNYIHFVFNQDYNEYSNMNISPKPDNVLRVYMLWADASSLTWYEMIDQEIPQLKREGFTLVEWGGSQMPSVPLDL